jgi:hypothetical protein
LLGDLGIEWKTWEPLQIERPSGQTVFRRRIEIPVPRQFPQPIFEESIKLDDTWPFGATSNKHQDCPIPQLQFEMSPLWLVAIPQVLELFKKVFLVWLISDKTHDS